MRVDDIFDYDEIEDNDKVYLIIMKDEGIRWKTLRHNKGFNSLELLGLLERCKDSVISQMEGLDKPEIVDKKFYGAR
jgi:hypothetical protein